ncbi:hypothetical protein KKC44_06825, partial [Patescibacteria group bacterium]|nr:hypothetical protein [Patescibacteria group bacterium]
IATYSGSTILSQSQLEEALEMEGDSLSVRRVLKALAGLVVRDSLNVLGPANFDKLLTAAGGIMATDLTLSGGLTANGSVLFLDDLIVKGALVANSINVEHDAAIGGLLSASTLDIASGATIHGGLSVEGELLVNGKPITGADIKLNAESKIDLGQLIIHDTLFVLGDVTIEGVAKFLGDVEVVGNLSIKGEIKVASRHAGYAVIPQTGTFVTVMFDTQFSAIPIVSASPDTPVLFGVSKATATGFTIRLAGPATDEVTFSWLALTSEEPLISEGKRGDGLEIIEFPVDENGVPISTSNVWNGCIRGQAPLDSEGKPYNCSRYHDDDAWTHPDLFVEFTWNSERSPRLVLPEGYVVTPQEHPPVLSEAEGSLGEDGASPGAEDGAFPPVGSGAGLETDSGDVVNTGSGNTIPESGDDETGSGTTIPDDSETVSGEVIPDGGDDSESESEDPQETPDEENEEQPSGEESSSTEDAGDEDVAPEENNGDQITVDEESEDAGDEEIGEGGEENNE